MQRDVEEEFLELDDFRPDAAACLPPSEHGFEIAGSDH
jgi:hypothetical protein